MPWTLLLQEQQEAREKQGDSDVLEGPPSDVGSSKHTSTTSGLKQFNTYAKQLCTEQQGQETHT